jgi:hypothetical protein
LRKARGRRCSQTAVSDGACRRECPTLLADGRDRAAARAALPALPVMRVAEIESVLAGYAASAVAAAA